MDSLANKYRPKTFGDVVGQKMTRLVMDRLLKADMVDKPIPSAYLFSGPRGTGKTSSARIFAAGLNCTGLPPQAINVVEHETVPCGYCESCIAVEEGSSLDVIEIDAASNGSVEAVRELVMSLRFAVSGRHRVVILDEAHSMSSAAFNALLKPLEEAFGGTIFILVTTEPHKLPDTILSRVEQYEFPRLPPADILSRLEKVAEAENISLAPQLLNLIATSADGSLRDALMLLDQVVWAEVTTIEGYFKLTGFADVGPVLLTAMLTGDYGKVYMVTDKIRSRFADPHEITAQLVALFTDLLVLKSDGEVLSTGGGLTKRLELAAKLENERILAAMKIVWDSKTKIRQSDDAAGNLNLVLALMTEVLTRGRKVAPPPVSRPTVVTETLAPRKLSLAELKEQ